MPKLFSFGNLKLIPNSPQGYIWKNFQLDINYKIEQKSVVQAKKLSVAVLKSNYQFSEQQLLRKFLKKSILFKFFWSRAAKGSLVSSQKELTFLVDRLFGLKEIQKNFFKKVFFWLALSNWFDKLKKTYMSTHSGRENERPFFSNFKQLMINKFSQLWVVSVPWRFLGRKYQR